MDKWHKSEIKEDFDIVDKSRKKTKSASCMFCKIPPISKTNPKYAKYKFRCFGCGDKFEVNNGNQKLCVKCGYRDRRKKE